MKVLVTGSNGFIGRHLSSAIKTTHIVIGQIRNTGVDFLPTADLIEMDISGESDWDECLRGVDVIVHLAAVAHNKSNDGDYISEVNVDGTIRLALLAADSGVKRFIFISSIGVFGPQLSAPFSELSPCNPCSPYAESKFKAEQALQEISEQTDLEVVIIRPPLVYGVKAPGNFQRLVRLVQLAPLLPFGLCDNKRSVISIDNLVDFISVCIDHPDAKNDVFCVSDGVDVSIKRFTNEIAKGLGKRMPQFPIPNIIFKMFGAVTGKQDQIYQLIGDLLIDSRKAQNVLGWAPPFTMGYTLSKLERN